MNRRNLLKGILSLATLPLVPAYLRPERTACMPPIVPYSPALEDMDRAALVESASPPSWVENLRQEIVRQIQEQEDATFMEHIRNAVRRV